MTRFNDLGLCAPLLKALEAQKIDTPTPIQKRAIPEALAGRDVMGLAQTGTGKTAAFGLPLVHKLLEQGGKANPKTARALILAPTRELAKQINEALFKFTRKTNLGVAVVVGGQSIGSQSKRMARGADILVATPGRLIDHLDRGSIKLDETGFLVLDEADQMLDMGFIHALRQIAPLLPRRRQTMLFSATMPKQMEEIAGAYLNDPVKIETNPPGQAASRIAQSVHYIAQGEKFTLLTALLSGHEDQTSLVFCRTKYGAERIMKNLRKAGFETDSIHGNKSQGQRDRALKAFKTGDIQVLVATDVAARGIDIPGVSFVYNYEIPHIPENYVHRIGRTARAGKKGIAVAFCAPDEQSDLRAIEALMKISVKVASGEPAAVDAPKPARRGRGGGGGNRPGGGKPKSGRPGGAGRPRSAKSAGAKPGSAKPNRSRRRRPAKKPS